MRWHAIFDYIGLKISHHRLEHKFAFYHTDAKNKYIENYFSPSHSPRPYTALHVEDLAQVCEAQRRNSLLQLHLFLLTIAIVPYGLIYCTEYSYMYTEVEQEYILYLLEQQGQPTLISFYTSAGYTEYHGEEHILRGRGLLVTELQFNDRGHQHPLKSTYLVQTGSNPRSYDGYDDAARLISMKELRRWYWHEKLEFWISL